jgi:hypothetical protein
MRKEIKKAMSLSILIFGVVFLAGCGAKTETSKSTENKPAKKTQTEQNRDAAKNIPEEKNANLNSNSAASADNEDLLLSQEESEATEALPDSQEIDDLSDTYDENNL